MGDHITRYNKMPIPPIQAHTTYFDAGVIRIGVEYRLLTDAVAASARPGLMEASGGDIGKIENLDDRGVSLHVFGRTGGEYLEYLRFDCFREEPHYHYVSWANRSNEVLHIDTVVEGDPLAWALDRIQRRLPQMLERAGMGGLAAEVDVRAIERAMPRVTEEAYRVRYESAAKAASAA